MAKRKSEPPFKPPDLGPDRAISVLKQQLDALQRLRGRRHDEAKQEEREWSHFTEAVITRAFGSPSKHESDFHMARAAGRHYIGGVSDTLLQQNFEERIRAHEALINSCIRALELSLPEPEITGVYDAGAEYAFYKDLKGLLQHAKRDVFIVDAYLDTDVFDMYVDRVAAGVPIRILTGIVATTVKTVAEKFQRSRGGLTLHTSTEVHDRVIFVDDRCWVIGQSMKDAAKKKPTYIVEHDGVLMRKVYEDVWLRSANVL